MTGRYKPLVYKRLLTVGTCECDVGSDARTTVTLTLHTSSPKYSQQYNRLNVHLPDLTVPKMKALERIIDQSLP